MMLLKIFPIAFFLAWAVPAGAAGQEQQAFRLGNPRLAKATPCPVSESRYTRSKHLVLEAQRNYARPQDRWVDLVIQLQGLPEDLSEYTVSASMPGLDEAKPFHFTPASHRILLQADSRQPGQQEIWIEIVLKKGEERVDSSQYLFKVQGPEQPLVSGAKIPVKIDVRAENKAKARVPVVVGVPFAPGQLWDESRVSLQSKSGDPVPFQRKATGTWIEGGSIQWVQFRTTVAPEEELVVAIDAETKPAKDSPTLLVSKAGDQWVLRAGTSELRIGQGASPILSVFREGISLASGAGARGLYLIDSKGRLAQSGEADIVVESEGPVAASIRIEADYVTKDGEKVARHITRLESHADSEGVAITHTLILTRDTNEIWFTEAGWELSIPDYKTEELLAVFNVDASNLDKVLEIPLTEETSDAFIIQQSFPSIGGGIAAFRAGITKSDGEEVIEAKGPAMGDWGGYRNDIGGLFWCVKDAARQHPKEFRISKDKINLLFFSGRDGEEMDFRTETLEKRWAVDKSLDPAQLEKFRQNASNAIGWSKTHELILLPVAGDMPHQAVAETAVGLRHPAYAMVDPSWIYQSYAMGPLYPYDPERFPESEQLMAKIFRNYVERVPGERYNGFYDYFAGPHYGFAGRYRLTYTLLHDAWLYAARTGNREVREFTEGANRAFRDNYISHWDSGTKIKGLYISASSGSEPWQKSNFPFYWEEGAEYSLGTTTSLMQFIWDYQFSGNRRSAEVAHDFSKALKENWSAEKPSWRAFMVLRVLAQAYQFTNDGDLLCLIEETANKSIYDPEGEFLMSIENRPYGSSLYKTNTDVGIMIHLWELLGTERWHTMALRTSEYWWRNRLGLSPITRISGTYLNFLYRQTDSAAVAQNVDFNLRAANVLLDPRTGEVSGVAFSTLDTIFQGIPYGMDVVVQSDADRTPVASMIEYDDYGTESAWFVKKDKHPRVVLYAQPPAHHKGTLKPRLEIEAVETRNVIGLDLIRMQQFSDGVDPGTRGAIEIVIPKDAANVVYRINPLLRGNQFAIADSVVPLVFRTDGYWRPSTLRPGYRYYFQIPESAADPAIFVETATLLYQPDGSAWQDGKLFHGNVALPPDMPGLWSLQPMETGLIKGINVPPYFSVNSAEAWFDPGEPRDESGNKGMPAPSPRSEGVFVGEGKKLTLQAAKHNEELFDHKEGTIEFFFKPKWGTFDLRNGNQDVVKPIFTVQTDKTPWQLNYRIDPMGTKINLGPREPSHSFFGQLDTEVADGKLGRQIRVWLTRQILEPDQWVHVAFVWGKEKKLGARNTFTTPSLTVYINGVGQTFALQESFSDSLPVGQVRELQFPPDLDATISQLRISDSRRYIEDFAPPTPDMQLIDDEQTLLLLSFDGNLKASSSGKVKVAR